MGGVRCGGTSWRTASQVTISLRRCDGGEEVQRLTFVDPELLRFFGGRTSSED